jgi:hypothetical protein
MFPASMGREEFTTKNLPQSRISIGSRFEGNFDIEKSK